MTKTGNVNLEQLVKNLPSLPGVYMMKDEKGEVIYVGKAANLRVRVRSYLRGQDERYQVKFLMRRVADIECMVTDTEKEALILEDILIKKHRPRYNINLKDDKTYLSLRVDMKQDFPKVEVVRRRQKDGALYFGPYSSAQALRETIGLLQRIFQIRTCSESYFRNRTRPCLSYQIKRCLGPCCGLVEQKDYSKLMDEVVLFLQSKSRELIKRFKRRMKDASDRMEFEEAARLRDCLKSMEVTLESQKVYTAGADDRDIVGLWREAGRVGLYIMFIRSGKLSGGRFFSFEDQQLPDEELISSFIGRYYGGGRYVPAELIVPVDIEDVAVKREWLADMRRRSVVIKAPKRGEKRKLLSLAVKNAENSLTAKGEDEGAGRELLEQISILFSLNRLPEVIECFDISNLQGENAVGSMVVFVNGKGDKSRYKRFKIKAVKGPDDFAMMYEVLKRRLERGLEEGALPDLVLIDGGRGHLGVGMKVLEDLEFTGRIDLLSIAKEKIIKRHGSDEKREERIYLPGRKNPVKLKDKGSILFLFQRIRDEAHRFAITYHKKLRGKKVISSVLDAIEGVGPAKKKALLRHFGSLKGVKGASLEELKSVSGITEKIAKDIKSKLSKG